MRTQRAGKRCRFALVALAASWLAAGAALAQGPTVDPGGAAPAAPAAAPAAPPQPSTIIIPINPQTGQPIAPAPQDTSPNPDGFYHYDAGMGAFDQPVVLHAGPTPELHVVRSGDTLWDICFYYFNDPWQWPKIWSYNEQITNPHWIYPGDLVRMVPRGVFVGLEAPEPTPEPEPAPAPNAEVDPRPAPARRLQVSLRQTAFVEQAELEQSIRIDGAVEEKELLSQGDEVYLTYPASKPPKVGKRYSVYVEGGKVTSEGKAVGSYVRLLGSLEVRSVKKDRRARGVLLETFAEIERGARVGPLLTQFKSVPPVPAKTDVQGNIVAMLSADQLIGQGELVFLDLGKSKVQVGNRMTVVRRGDGYESSRGVSTGVGQDDRRFPARALGEVVIVEVGKNISIGLVTLAVQELGVGDMVMMQKAQTR